MDILEKRVKVNDPTCAEQLADGLQSLFSPIQSYPIVIICIGTDRSTGDCLGPLIGTLLQDVPLHHFHCYGTLDTPIHALNLQDSILMIKQEHPTAKMIAIDACLGEFKNMYSIKIGNGPIHPGKAVQKKLPAVGDFHITGIVNQIGPMVAFVLQSTRLSVVMNMAKQIAHAITIVDQANHSLKRLV